MAILSGILHFLGLPWLQLVHTSALLHSGSHWASIPTILGARTAVRGI